MRKLTDVTHNQNDPFLAPLGAKRGLVHRLRAFTENMPSASAPIAVTLVGGLGLVIVLGAILGGQPTEETVPQQVAQIVEEDSPDLDPGEPAAAPAEAAAPTVAAVAEPPPPAEPTSVAIEAPPPPVTEAFQTAQDMEQTASILSAMPAPADLRPTVDVAETDEQVAALEVIQRREVEADVGPADMAAMTEIASAPAVAMRTATTTKYVNMRAAPDDDAEVMLVVPANARIEAQDDCNWCAVAYEGKSGYIYRTFLSYQ